MRTRTGAQRSHQCQQQHLRPDLQVLGPIRHGRLFRSPRWLTNGWLETPASGSLAESYTSAIPAPLAPASRQNRSTSPGLPFDDSSLLRISTRMPDHANEPLSA